MSHSLITPNDSPTSQRTKPYVTVVVPCFNEEGNVEELWHAIRNTFGRVPQYRFDVLFIDNASTDGTRSVIRKLAARDRRVRAIFNARNFGHIRSPFYAVLQTDADAVIGMVADFQDPPEMIPQLLEHWEQGAKIVVGAKTAAEESWLFYNLRKYYYRTLKKLSDLDLYENATGFGLYDRSVVQYLKQSGDSYPYFRGLLAEIGHKPVFLPYKQPLRRRGITKNNFYTLYDLAMLGLTSHSKVPLRLATMLGFFTGCCSLVVAAIYFVLKLVVWYDYPAGTAPMVIGLFFFSSVQLFFLGLLGEYILAIHTQVLNRPLVVEQERLNFDYSVSTDSEPLPESCETFAEGASAF
ncbi:MAG: glycosyltransferase [Pirellula sp.]|nr:glycosyltransferase [Pirellula sp.]